MRLLQLSILILSICLLTIQCSTTTELDQNVRQADGRYDSEFPQQSISKELDRISSSVRQMNCVAFYMTYFFDPDNPLTQYNYGKYNLDSMAYHSMVTNESVSGTAIVLYNEPRLVGMLTCAHVVDFPDTLVTRYSRGQMGLRSVSVKIKQQNFVSGLPEGEPVEVVVMDDKKDIAILKKVLEPHEERIDVMDYPHGKSKQMDWGTVVYTLGYPLGNLMVTQSIVSKPVKKNSGFFLTDGLYNQGISGSPVFALRDGVDHMEWVGMASSASASLEYVLEPEVLDAKAMVQGEVFTGEILIDKKKSINYGISYSVSIEEILTFIANNDKKVSAAGFNVDYFFQKR